MSAAKAAFDQFIQDLRAAWAELPDTDGRAGLLNLADFLAQQTEALGV